MNDFFKIEINGVEYSGFTKTEVFLSMENLVSAFSFETESSLKSKKFPISKGDSCKIWIGDTKVVTGFVNGVGGDKDKVTKSTRIRGRAKPQDLIDGNIKSNIDFRKGTTLKTIIERVLKVQGITDIKVIDLVGDIRPFSDNELVSAPLGIKAFDFINVFCQLRQVLCSCNDDGDIVLQRASDSKYEYLLKSVIDDMDNNILSSSFDDNDSDRFGEYIAISQGNMLFDTTDGNSEYKKGKSIFDDNIRKTRVFVLNSDISSDIQTLEQRATWESNIRRTRGFNYTCKIKGCFLDEDFKTLIRPNNKIQVIDDDWGINSELLIKSCRYRKSTAEGTTTIIDLVLPESYILQAKQDALRKLFNNQNSIFQGLGL